MNAFVPAPCTPIAPSIERLRSALSNTLATTPALVIACIVMVEHHSCTHDRVVSMFIGMHIALAALCSSYSGSPGVALSRVGIDTKSHPCPQRRIRPYCCSLAHALRAWHRPAYVEHESATHADISNNEYCVCLIEIYASQSSTIANVP